MDSDEMLIYLVRKHDCLYNINAKNYSNRNSKNNAWEKVSEEMNLSVDECQKKWKIIRDCYRKALKLRKASGSARVKKKPIKFENELDFLKPYVSDKTQKSNLDSSEIEEDITDTDSQNLDSSQIVKSPKPRPRPTMTSQLSNSYGNEQPLKMLQTLYRDLIEAKKHEDPTDSFFLTMSRKIKSMPKKIQKEIEKDIFRIVNEAEMKLAQESK